MTLSQLNTLSLADARHAFMQCCTSSAWVNAMADARPYVDTDALFAHADAVWQQLAEGDYLEAFEGHPKIGDISSLRAKYANTLSQGNSEYEDKFGFIFIVCATGKSAAQMLALLQARLPNDRATELVNAVEEQSKIFHLRITKMLESNA